MLTSQAAFLPSSPSTTPTFNHWLGGHRKSSCQWRHPPLCPLITILTVKILALPFSPVFPLLLMDHCLTSPACPVPSHCCCKSPHGIPLIPLFTNLALEDFQKSSLFIKPHFPLFAYICSMDALANY